MFGIIKCCSDYKALELKLDMPGAGCRSAEEDYCGILSLR